MTINEKYALRLLVFEDLLDSTANFESKYIFFNLLKHFNDHYQLNFNDREEFNLFREKLNRIYEEAHEIGQFLSLKFLFYWAFYITHQAIFTEGHRKRKYWSALMDEIKINITYKTLNKDLFKNFNLIIEHIDNKIQVVYLKEDNV